MVEPFIGEIRMFAGNFAPRAWALCDGQLQAVSQNDALFSLLGTTYGGDGRTTFGLPDLRGRIPIHHGQGNGLSNRPLGQSSGTENETLINATLPSHSHAITASAARATSRDPSGQLLAATEEDLYASPPGNTGSMASNAAAATGGSQQHTNIMPFQCINFIIALFGVYPSRS